MWGVLDHGGLTKEKEASEVLSRSKYAIDDTSFEHSANIRLRSPRSRGEMTFLICLQTLLLLSSLLVREGMSVTSPVTLIPRVGSI